MGMTAMIIGISNLFRTDDAVGLVVARRVRDEALPHVQVLELQGEVFALLDLWEHADTVVLIDAVASGVQPGTISRFEAHAQPIPSACFHSSAHGLSVAKAIELARALKQLPRRLIVYGVEAQNFGSGIALSPEVEQAVPGVVERILAEVRCTNSPSSPT
jgi:hydrogenase maturation protease